MVNSAFVVSWENFEVKHQYMSNLLEEQERLFELYESKLKSKPSYELSD